MYCDTHSVPPLDSLSTTTDTIVPSTGAIMSSAPVNSRLIVPWELRVFLIGSSITRAPDPSTSRNTQSTTYFSTRTSSQLVYVHFIVSLLLTSELLFFENSCLIFLMAPHSISKATLPRAVAKLRAKLASICSKNKKEKQI